MGNSRHISRTLQNWLKAGRANTAFVALCATFVVITAVYSVLWFAHQINPDATSYFSIAEKYARFDRHALNGYWGPLLSWLLVPAVWFHVDLGVAARLVNIAAATGILAQVYTLLRRHAVSVRIATGVSTFMAPLFTNWILAGAITPDLIMALLIVTITIMLERFVDRPTVRAGVAIGCIGALMYFCKGFGFYLFVAILGGVIAWQWIRQRRFSVVLRQFAPTMTAFCLLVIPFILLLSVKYHHFTISSAGAYNQRAFGPVVQGDHPILEKGPLTPPNDTAPTAWEDPTYLVPMMQPWSPLGSASNRDYFLQRIVWHNLDLARLAIISSGAAVSAGVILVVLGCFGRRHRRLYRLMALVGGIETLGYSLVLIEPRYLWSLTIFGLISLGLWVGEAERSRLMTKLQITIGLIIVLLASFILLPQQISDAHQGATRSYDQSTRIGAIIPEGAKVMADNFAEYYPCYYLKLRCYGVLETPAIGSETSYIAQVRAAGVSYLIDYHTRDTDQRFARLITQHFTPISAFPTPGSTSMTTIYRLNYSQP